MDILASVHPFLNHPLMLQVDIPIPITFKFKFCQCCFLWTTMLYFWQSSPNTLKSFFWWSEGLAIKVCHCAWHPYDYEPQQCQSVTISFSYWFLLLAMHKWYYNTMRINGEKFIWAFRWCHVDEAAVKQWFLFIAVHYPTPQNLAGVGTTH